MYPAEGFGTVDDLPDSINYTDTFTSFTLTKVEPFSYGGMTVYYVSDLELERYLGVSDEPIFDPGDCKNPDQTLGWVSGSGLQVAGQCCLIRGLLALPEYITDNFADTYAVTYLPNPLPGEQSISVTVSRTSLCVWEGLDGCNRPWYLIYGDSIFGAGSAFTWKVAMAIDENDPCKDFVQQAQDKNSNEFNNTPVGNYTQGDYPASVS